MLKGVTNWEIPAGTKKTYKLTILSAGVATDLTGCTLHFTVKERYDQADSAAFINTKISSFGADPTLGLVDLPIDLTSKPDSQFEVSEVYHANFVIVDSAGETTHSEEFQITTNIGSTKDAP